MTRFVDWLALTRRGQRTAGALEALLVLLAFALTRVARRLSRTT